MGNLKPGKFCVRKCYVQFVDKYCGNVMVISKIKQTNLDKKMFTNIGTCSRVEVYS